MKQVIRIEGYLPSSTNSAEQQAAVEVISIVTDIATTNSGSAEKFSFADGAFTVEVSGDEAIKAVVDAFAAEKGVTVQTLTPLQASRLLNLKRQEKADKMKATKQAKKAS